MDTTLYIVFALGQDLGRRLEFRPKLNNISSNELIYCGKNFFFKLLSFKFMEEGGNFNKQGISQPDRLVSLMQPQQPGSIAAQQPLYQQVLHRHLGGE